MCSCPCARPRLLAILSALLMTALFASLPSLAQSSPAARKAPPPPPPPPARDQQQFLSYWTTETGWRTELQLRNNQVGLTLTVTPVLRTADGTETALPSVVVQPQEVKTIDLATAIGNSAPQLIGTYGSAALRFRAPSLANLYAVSMVMGVGHSVAFHIDAAGEDLTQNVGSREGIWWLPNGAASDFLILVNHGQNPLQLNLSLFDATGKPSRQSVTLPPRSMNRLSIRPLVAAAGLAGSFGGIKVSATTHAGSLDTLHVLFDSDASFSAVMKMFDYDPRAQLKERDYAATGQWTLRAPMLALSTPDPALAFPVGTALQPQLFIRNTTAKSIDASLTFNWRTDAATGKASGPALHLLPYETRRIDVAALQDGNTLPKQANWASVTLTTNGNPDELVAVAASYDATLRYGAQTPFSDQLSGHWVGGQWQYDTQHDSIITAGNGTAKPTQAGFTIFYNQGAQKYQLVQTLQPGEQMWMDIGKLIREQVPDKDGKTLPADLTSGSYEVRDLNNKAAASLFEGKVVYDRTYGHVTYGCAACCGYTDPIFNWYDPLSVFFQGIADDGVDGWYPCESQYDDISAFFFNHWSSGNTAIVTVDYYGTHTGVSVGSTTSQAFASVPNNNARLRCPALGQNPSGGANVRPTVVIQGNPTYVYIGQDPTVVQINALFGLGNPSGGTYTWSTPDTTTSFDTPNAEDVHVTATNWTGGIQDTKIALDYTYNNQSATQASVWVTKRIFKFLAGDSVIEVNTYNGPSQYGYEFQASYNVFANPGGVQLTTGSGVSTYENVTNISSNVPFRPNYGQGALTANSQLLDTLALVSNAPLPSTLSILDSQDLGVGGLYVRNNTLTYSSTAVTVTNNGPYK